MLKFIQEFRAWLIEEKMINREALARDQERKLFASFVEDYNTATLPHEKYYVETLFSTSGRKVLTDLNYRICGSMKLRCINSEWVNIYHRRRPTIPTQI